MMDWDRLVIGPCMKVFGEKLKPSYQRMNGAVPVGAPFDVEGVFDDAYTALVINGDAGDPEIATQDPVMGVRLANFGATPPKQGDKVTVPRVAKPYLVMSYEPDGKGWAFLHLKLTA